MIRDKSFYRQFFTMMLVLVLQNIITLSVNLADNMMLGAYSETSLAGVAAVNQIQFVYQQLLMAAGEGIVILGTQYLGKGQMKPVKRIASIAMHTALIMAVVLFALVSVFPHQAMSIFTTDQQIIAEGMRYLSTIRYTYLFFAVTQLLLALLRSTGSVRIALYLSGWSLVVNCALNYTLIYGHFGAPRLGVTGAAIGTLTARITELILLVIYIIKKEHRLSLGIRDFLCSDALLRKDYFRVTLPVMTISGLWGLNNAAQNAILGHMSSRAIAANSVASTQYLLVKSIAVGMSSATGFFIGKTIGEGDEKKLKALAKTMQVLFVCIGLIAGLILFLIRIPLLSVYRLEPETRQLANQFLLILSVVMITMSYQMPTNNGIIRGGGDSAFVMKMDLISIWGIVMPISFIMAFVVKASPVLVVCCLNADQVFKCIPAFIKCNYGHWAKKLTR